MKILVTRPQDQAKQLRDFLQNQQIETFIEPLFAVEKLPITKPNFVFSAIIITSINACFALEKCGFDKNIKIFTIGKKTAQEIAKFGFKNIEYSKENSAQSLSNLIKDFQENILYLRGFEISFDFATEFKNITEITIYKINWHEEFSPQFLQFCQKNKFDEILLFSLKSAENFLKLAKKHNLLEYFSSAKIVVFSEKILRYVANYGFKKIETFASNPILKKFYE